MGVWSPSTEATHTVHVEGIKNVTLSSIEGGGLSWARYPKQVYTPFVLNLNDRIRRHPPKIWSFKPNWSDVLMPSNYVMNRTTFVILYMYLLWSNDEKNDNPGTVWSLGFLRR